MPCKKTESNEYMASYNCPTTLLNNNKKKSLSFCPVTRGVSSSIQTKKHFIVTMDFMDFGGGYFSFIAAVLDAWLRFCAFDALTCTFRQL